MNILMKQLLDELNSVVMDEYTVEVLRASHTVRIEYDTDAGVYKVYRRQCYYGGCDYDVIMFDSEYQAYKNARIIYLLRKINNLRLNNKGNGVHITDVNTACPSFEKCADIV